MNAPMLPKTSSCGCGGAGSACSCGGAGCEACQGQVYVRPRFFAGQLLTEDDLQTLGEYVASKNRLHNRHLMGAGVVCGLEVSCDPCGGGGVKVQPGYALDCCGNDIVLACAVHLDINAMVRDLRRDLLGGYDCGDPCVELRDTERRQDTGDAGAKADDAKPPAPSRTYCLYVRYCEALTEPVTPYASDEPCGAATCEASRIREGLRFELRCREDTRRHDDFAHRFLACLGDLTAADRLAKTIEDLLDNPAAHLGERGEASSEAAAGEEKKMLIGEPTAARLAEAKETLLDRLDRTPGLTDCALRAYVAAIALPAAGSSDTKAAEKLAYAYGRLLRDCFCRALNPPCAPCEDPAVLLACLEVRDCEVVDICNLERTYVLSAVAFRHWVPTYFFGDLLEWLCCAEIAPPEEEAAASAATGTIVHTGTMNASAARDTRTAVGGTLKASTPGASTSAMTEKMLPAVLRSARLPVNDALKLRSVFTSVGRIARSGVFDRVFPVTDAVSLVQRQRATAASAGAAPTPATTSAATDKIAQERIAEEVQKQVQAAVASQTAELGRMREMHAALERRHDELVAKLEKGTPQ